MSQASSSSSSTSAGGSITDGASTASVLTPWLVFAGLAGLGLLIWFYLRRGKSKGGK